MTELIKTDEDWTPEHPKSRPSRVSDMSDYKARFVMVEATENEVSETLLADPTLPDGWTRSEFLWIRLPNGDLILGTFPQDELYEAISYELGGF